MGIQHVLHHPASSKWPRLELKVTFSRLKWISFGESKGHFEESGLWWIMLYYDSDVLIYGYSTCCLIIWGNWKVVCDFERGGKMIKYGSKHQLSEHFQDSGRFPCRFLDLNFCSCRFLPSILSRSGCFKKYVWDHGKARAKLLAQQP